MAQVKFGKWLGGGLGWVMGGPLGAIIGFSIGSMFDNAEVVTSRQIGGATGAGDFTAALLVLSAAVMKSDGRVMQTELDFVKRFLVKQFGEASAKQQLLLLKEIIKKEIPLHDVCLQIKHHMPQAARLQLLHYLFGISKADGHVHQTELDTIETIASYLAISAADMNSMKAMYFRDAGSDYRILEITPQATDEEVKKAYRKMAVKYHPDKVAHLGDDVQKGAKEKFQKVLDAYENIKKQRGMS